MNSKIYVISTICTSKTLIGPRIFLSEDARGQESIHSGIYIKLTARKNQQEEKKEEPIQIQKDLRVAHRRIEKF